MIILSPRLAALAEAAGGLPVAADIGCDHCLTIMYMLENGLCERAIGTDAKRGPLGRASLCLERFGFAGDVPLRLGYGLDTLSPGEANVIILAGMGGRLINDILERGHEVASAADKLVLQPQDHWPEVRRGLHERGFRITAENMVTDAGKYYTIIEAARGTQCYEREMDYEFGAELLAAGCPVLAAYLKERRRKNTGIIERLRGLGGVKCGQRLAGLTAENGRITEALACLLK